MATTTFNFGRGYRNSSDQIWAPTRQILTLPKGTGASSVFAAPNRPVSSATSITIPFRMGETRPPSGVYDNVRVIIFKGFNNSYFTTGDGNLSWFNFLLGDRNGACKSNSSDPEGTYFKYSNISKLVTTPLAYFDANIPVQATQDFFYTFTNPTFTDAGRNLANWYVSSSDDNDASKRLYVGFYRNVDSEKGNWDNDATLNWSAPWEGRTDYVWDVYTTLTLGYGAGGTVKYFDGSQWKDCETYYYDGSNWKACEAYYHDGSNWKTIG